MSADRASRAALALHRFGMGPRLQSIAEIASDPQEALLAELRDARSRLANGGLLSTGEAARETFAFREERKAERMAARESQHATVNSKNDLSPQEQSPDRKMGPGVPQQIYLTEADARYRAALDAPIGIVERLVWFWSNHFCVSADKGAVRSLCGAFEREAIRPHVLGKFADMLLAVETHPAMLFYLDNVRSIGPQSPAGMRQRKGLNENLAREILELHTLGVRTVYDQADVTSFANVITGWTIRPLRQDPERGGEFIFNPRMHEPGAQRVLAKTYAENGFEQGRAVLRDVAVNPVTANHIATKLVRHFVADEPPSALVSRLAQRFAATRGDLRAVTEELIAAPESWAAPRKKLKKPSEWILASLRSSGAAMPDARRIIQMQNLLGEPLWRPPAPQGFSDDSAAWVDGVSERLDISQQIARLAPFSQSEPDALIDAALGPLASNETRQTIRRAESRTQAFALLLMSPEFQRR
jgi:uncharacterized protein (DUF1800 family)